MAVAANIESDFDSGPLYYNKDTNYNAAQYSQKSLSAFLSALAKEESGGQADPYTAVGTTTKSGDRAYGKYQIMGANIPSWTKQYLGKSMTIQQFVNDPQAQDELMQKRATALYKQYGNWADVASVHFSGQPTTTSGVMSEKDANGTSTQGYIQNVMSTFDAIMGGGVAHAGTVQDTTPSGGMTAAQLQSAGAQPVQQTPGTPPSGGMTLQQLQESGAQPTQPGSSVAPGNVPNPGAEIQYDPSNQGLEQFLVNTITAVPQATASTAYNIAKFTGQAAEDVPRVGATAGAGIMTAAEQLGGNKNAAQDVKQAMSSNPTVFKPFDNAYDYLGGLLNTASWAVGGPEDVGPVEAAGSAAEDAVAPALKTAATKIGNFAKTYAHPFLGGMGVKGALGFSALQGASTAAKTKGAGGTGSQATTAGVLSGVGALGTLAGLGVAGKTAGYFADTFSRTAAAKYTQKMFQGAIEGIQNAITDGMRSTSADTVVASVNDATKQFASGMKNAFNSLTKSSGGLFKSLPSARMAVNDMVGGIYDRLKPMRSAFRQGFAEVYRKAPDLSLDSDGGRAVIQAFNEAKAAAGQSIYDSEQEEAKATIQGTTAGLSPTLDKYLSRFALDVIHPLQTNGSLPMKVLDDVIHFLSPTGNPTEEAIGAKLQDALHSAFADNLKTKDPQTYNQWQQLRSNFSALAQTWDEKFKQIFTNGSTPETIASKFLDGNLVTNPNDTEILNQLLGKTGMQKLLSYINKTLTERAGRAYEQAVGVGTPDSVKAAGAQVTEIFDSAIKKLTQGNSDYGEFVPAEMVNMWTQMKSFASNDMFDLGKTAADAGLIDKSALEQLQQTYQNLKGGSKAFAAAISSPAKMAEKIVAMAPEEIAGVKATLGNRMITGADGSSVKAWDVVTGNVLKNILSKATSAFGKTANEEVLGSLRNELDSLGGSNRDEVLKQLFGDYKGMDMVQGFKGLFDALDYSTALAEKKGAVVRGMAHGLASFFFAAIHHPMFSAGEARQSIRAFSQSSLKDMEKQFEEQLTKNGNIQTGPFKKALSAIRTALLSYPIQQLAPRGTESEVAPVPSQSDTSQPEQLPTPELP